MKALKIIGNPVVVVCIFLLVLISGEQFGGFYSIYLLLGLPNGAPHAIIALIGIVCMLLGYTINSRQYNRLKPLFCVIGGIIMIIALFIFFKGSKGYNDETFHQTVPVLTFVLLAICIASNILISASIFLKWNDKVDRDYSITP